MPHGNLLRMFLVTCAVGIFAAILFLSFRTLKRFFRKQLPGADLSKDPASIPGLVMKVNPEGGILYANQEVDRTLYGMGLPPQHAELLLPDDAAAMVRDILDSEGTVRALTCRTEGRTIEYTLYRIENEDAVLFHGVDITGEKGGWEEPLPSLEGETRTVLLVDDEDLVRDVAGAMLASLGYEVLTASNGQEGVDAFRRAKGRISFTLLDLQMPVMDGVRAYEEIRRIDPAAKIVISTGDSGDEEADRLKEQGATVVLSKPYSYGEIARLAGRFREPLPLPVQEP